ncbi:MAG: gallidermin/nisin family lantibiotic [Bacillota bacterium]
MDKQTLFDLDLQVKSVSGKLEPQVTSWFACTPGTCNDTCGSTSTFHSNCCWYPTKTCWMCP